MTDIPIIFSGPMVRALLDGRKTMTRRLAWGKPMPGKFESLGGKLAPIPRRSSWQNVRVGDRLYVRENFHHKCGDHDHAECTRFAATYDGLSGKLKWTPCIHMPRKLSRLTLAVTAVKTERLKDMSPADAIAEGLRVEPKAAMDLTNGGYVDGYYIELPSGQEIGGTAFGPVEVFSGLWTALHGPDAWGANPDVVALTFSVHHCNIDDLMVSP